MLALTYHRPLLLLSREGIFEVVWAGAETVIRSTQNETSFHNKE